jgi:putative ABC transport system substrate-binding protein
VNRRAFISFLGSAAAWPLAARGQQREPMRRVGFLGLSTDDPLNLARYTAFVQGMQEWGWAVGRNLQIDMRSSVSAVEIHQSAAELIALRPDVILATGGASVAPLQQLTRSIPIVFVQLVDPVSVGFVESLSRPGGNITGFMQFEFGTSGKWLELLKQIAPRVTRAAVLRDPTQGSGTSQLAAIQTVGPQLGVNVSPINNLDDAEIERSVASFAARAADGGLIITSGGSSSRHRALIIRLAAQLRLPAVYPYRYYVADGGLACYGPDTIEQYRRAASYVHRILKGDKPADLPVQAPTEFELVINLKTAKALGLEVSPQLLARADGVIE